MKEKLADIRTDYMGEPLGIEDVAADPFDQFENWFLEAQKAEVIEVNAMNLATVGESGIPSSRIVLLKGFDKNGFVFYTNYQSSKGKDLEQNAFAALNFFWPELHRQICIRGNVEKVSGDASTEYFQSRPKASQIGAWSSPQSTVIKNRQILEDRERQLTEKYKDQDVLPRPEQWGGYNVKPFIIEFWQGRPSRLHDRIVYSLSEDKWAINRLAP